MTTRQKSHPRFKLREDEERLYNDFIAEISNDYQGLLASDMRQVETAAVEYILHLRLVEDELQNNRHHLNTRYSHLGQSRAILNDLALSRKDRQRAVPVRGEAEQEMLDLLMGVSKIPTSEPIGRNHVT